MQRDNKRKEREEKRENKKMGNRWSRHLLKRKLTDHPEEAHWDDIDFGKFKQHEK